jgi:hypothetical protein
VDNPLDAAARFVRLRNKKGRAVATIAVARPKAFFPVRL